VYGCFGDDVGVESVTQIDGVDVVTTVESAWSATHVLKHFSTSLSHCITVVPVCYLIPRTLFGRA